MKLHTSLKSGQVYDALRKAKELRLVSPDVSFVNDDTEAHGSKTHEYSYEVQLGTYDQDSLKPGTVDQFGHKMRVRRYKNTGTRGAASEYYGKYGAVWAATWDEWGWFIAIIFHMDPTARWVGGGNYTNEGVFNKLTRNRFVGAGKLVDAVADMQRVARNLESDRASA